MNSLFVFHKFSFGQLAMRLGVYSLVIVPAVFAHLFFPFFSTKAFFVYGIALSLGCILLTQRPWSFLWSLGQSAISKTWMLFLIVQIVATIGGFNPVESFWSQPHRHTGLLLLLSLTIIFVALLYTLLHENSWKKIFSYSICVSIVISIVHLSTLTPFPLLKETWGGSTLGQSSFFGTYLLFSIGFCCLLFFWKSTSTYQRILSVLGGCLLIFTLFTTNARAAQFSIVFGLFTTLFLWFVLRVTRPHMYRFAWAGMIGMFISVTIAQILMLLPNNPIHDWFITTGGPTRIILWKTAWKVIAEHPWFGWGPENFSSAFLQYYPSCLGSVTCGVGRWADHAHNIFLDVLVGSGIIGLIMYLLLFIVALKPLIQPSDHSGLSLTQRSVLAGLLGAYLLQNITGFDSVVSLLLFVVTLAFIQWSTYSKVQIEKQAHRKRVPVLLIILTLILWGGSLFAFVVQPTMAFSAVLKVSESTSYTSRMERYKQATNLSPAGRLYRRTYMGFLTSNTLWYATSATLLSSREDAYSELRLSISALTDSHTKHPDDLRTVLILSRLYQVESRLFRANAIQDAHQLLIQAQIDYPTNPLPSWYLTSILLEQDRFQEAQTLADKMLTQHHDDPSAYIAQAIVAKLSNNDSLLQTIIDEALEQFPTLATPLQQIAHANPQSTDRLVLLNKLESF